MAAQATGRPRSSPRVASESGAILIQVGVAIIVLIAFSMFVIDYGVMWVSRNQAQNSADAGALAGAIALGLDDPDDYSDTGPAKVAARGLALNNLVFGEAPDVAFTDITFSQVDMTGFPAECATANCVRVDVYRNQARGNPLPTWFGSLVGVTDQGVRAMAIAWVIAGNASKCLKPWGIADKWNESTPPGLWDPTQTFDPATGDYYEPPDGDDPGTGFTLENDLGTELRLKVGSPNDAINPGWFQALDLTGGGGNQYRENISGCVDRLWHIGDEIPKENGNMVGPTGQGTGDLIDLDPDAEWDDVNEKVINSCVEDNSCTLNGQPIHYSESPRIVAIPVFDLDYYLQTGGPGNGTVRVVNILGFFVDRVENPQNTVVGYLASKVDLYDAGAGTIAPEASFVKVIQLVR